MLFVPLGGIKKKLITLLFTGKTTTFVWDPDRWRWVEGCRFLKYTMKFCRLGLDINRVPGITRGGGDKWPRYFMGNYQVCWSQVWDLAYSSKEPAIMWLIWHKFAAVNEWSARIALAPSPNDVFSASPTRVNRLTTKFWNCIQARRA